MSAPNNAAAQQDEEEDDYMSMALPTDSTSANKASSSSIRAHIAKLSGPSDTGARQKSNSQLERERRAALQEGLNKPIDPESRGAKMLTKMGFKGGKLGVKTDETHAAVEKQGTYTDDSKGDVAQDGNGQDGEMESQDPIALKIKYGRGGLGHESAASMAKKRNEEGVKRKREEDEEERLRAEDDFVKRMRKDAADRKTEKQKFKARKILEGFRDEAKQSQGEKDGATGSDDVKAGGTEDGSDSAANREGHCDQKTQREGFVHDGERYQYHEVEPGSEDDAVQNGITEDGEAKDDEFAGLEPEEELAALIAKLREEHNYCFWCMERYPDEQMDGCPGLTEDEHG